MTTERLGTSLSSAGHSQHDHVHLTIEGQVCMVPVDEIPFAPVRGLPFGSPELMAYGYFVLLVGPTGSGKSSFIEALGDKVMGISKDQLEGMTQTVQAYQLLNATWVNGESVFVIDTPGLADEKISETRLFKLITDWMKEKKIETIHRILYFDRITDIRMSSSRWRSIETLIQAIQGFDQNSGGDVNTLAITHVTTMWDTVINDNQRRKVEVRFNEVKETISDWHALPDTALHLSKFHNTQSSAMSIIDFQDVILIRGWKKWEPFQSTRNFSPDDMQHTAPSNKRFGSFLYRTLMDRIRLTNEQLILNREELKGAKKGGKESQVDALAEQRKGIIDNLKQLEQDRQEFGEGIPNVDVDVPLDPPPSPTATANDSILQSKPGHKDEIDALAEGWRAVSDQAETGPNLQNGHSRYPLVVSTTFPERHGGRVSPLSSKGSVWRKIRGLKTRLNAIFHPRDTPRLDRK